MTAASDELAYGRAHPIEGAPLDREVLVCDENMWPVEWHVAVFVKEIGMWFSGYADDFNQMVADGEDVDDYMMHATHFSPLPETPASTARLNIVN
jgi:hypothetical protein